MMFVISELTLDINNNSDDERLKLYNKLCRKNPIFKTLQGKKILSMIEQSEETFRWKELFISPYIIYLEE